MSSKADSISTQQWAELQKIFDQAMELPEHERAAYVELACEGDEKLRKQVQALVIAADADEELVGDLIKTAADQVLEKNTKTRTQIGSFKVIDVIGTGGMGIVYLGQRIDDEYKQQVAIKILHDGLESEEALLRFKTERQILANLSHPNIARLLDGGQTDDGLPYLIMEYIDGVPLVAYCDQRRLTISERLDLFKQVCSAVALAHRSLIVHRDIKPGNILVDPSGVPKLLDFGIAKVLSNRFEQSDLAKTQLGDRLLTPDYASPEQVQGGAITTSSDIYSLGVLLFQLLCGTRPFRLVNKTPAEMEKIIISEIPKLPSKALGTVRERTDASRAIAADRRNTTVERLTRTLSGELDYIVLMALKKEPQLRYVSASQLAADITKYQKGQPITAVRDTRRYVAKKFVQRNKIPVAAAALLVASLLSFSFMTYQQSKKIAFEKSVSENALEFLTDVFKSSTPGVLQKEVVTAIDILDVGASRVEEQLQEQPAPRATLQRIIGLAYASNDLTEKAYVHLQRSLETRTELYGIDHPYTADVLQNLANLHSSEGQVEQALPLFEQALDVFKNPVSKRFFKNDRIKGQHAIAVAIWDLAEAVKTLGDLELAEQYAREALEITEGYSSFERYPTDHSFGLYSLSVVLQQQGKYEEAEEYTKTALELVEQREGPDSLAAARYLVYYANLHHALDRSAEAEQFYRRSIAIREGKLAPTASDLLTSKSNLARLIRDRGEPEKALDVLLDVVKTLRDYHGELLPYSSTPGMIDLSRVHIDLNQYSEAEALLAEAHEIHLRTSGKKNRYFTEVLREQGNLYVATGRYQKALDVFSESVEILFSMYGDNHWQTAVNKSEMSAAHLALEQYDEAQALLDMALPVLSKLLGAEHRLSRAARKRYQEVIDRRETVTYGNTAE